ncbi:ABC transporter permease [Psittacicella hinzii]|uniref:ABC transporter permease n=1 Tax=Psittacicella hinzii TaxID=2028575 RepID=A0A3A1YDL1_9GAMM|nr:ABC transporter permease [Psittacicella hinzii]RIY34264.1 ABC transporter permease [Psittacicella hinzii]
MSSKKLLTYTGLSLFLTLTLFAFLTPYFSSQSLTQQNLAQALQGYSAQNWLGTDHLGRDMLVRLAAALRISLGLILICVSLALVAGVITGFLAAYYGKVFEVVFSTLANLVQALPGLLLILLFAALAPGTFWSLYLGISLVMWVEFYRLVRAQALILVNSPALENSKLQGMGLWYLCRRHILPTMLPNLLTMASLGAGNAVLALATLGFAQVGLRPPTPELGLMMTELFPYYYLAPQIFILPILAVFILVLSLQLMASGVKSNDN